MPDEPVVVGGGGTEEPTPTVVDSKAESTPYDWRSDIHPEVKGDKLWESVPDVKSLTKGYADAVKYNVGALKLPAAEAPVEEWNRVWDKLGRPTSPEGYVIPEKIATPTLADLRGVAHTVGLSAKQWEGMMSGYGRIVDQEVSARQLAAKNTTEALKAEWGAAHDRKLGLVQRMILQYGDEEVMAEFNRSGQGNHAPTIKMLAKLAESMADEKFIDAELTGVVGKDAAKAELDSLITTPEYINPRHPSHKSTVERVTKLFQIVYN